MSHLYYKLVGRECVPCTMRDMTTPNALFQDRVMKDVFVSTVFLSVNHQFGEGPPVLFETLVFAGRLDGEMQRYSTYDEAERGHLEMLQRVSEVEGA